MVGAYIFFGIMVVVLVGLMLYGVFTEGRKR
jgi:hypothetical protein